MIFTDPYGHSSWSYTASADKVICEASTYEETPEGQAEWIKFFGYFFGKSTEAEASFCATESRYTCNSLVAKHKNVDSVAVPKVVFASAPNDWGGAAINMPPYKDIFVHDAGGVYPDMSAYESYKKLHFDAGGEDDRPLFGQLAGHDPQVVLSAARLIEDSVSAVDLNFGCPQAIARKGRYGAFLLEEPDVPVMLVETLARELSVPVTAKVRILPSGIEDSIELCLRMQDAGAAALPRVGELLLLALRTFGGG